jgi:hypothetical protein
VVPRVKQGAESIRGALDDLKKALGYSSWDCRCHVSLTTFNGSLSSRNAMNLVCLR